MTIVTTREPQYGAKIRKEYPIIGHFNQYAIIGNPKGEPLYIEDPEKVLMQGEYIEDLMLKPISALSSIEYNAILETIEGYNK